MNLSHIVAELLKTNDCVIIPDFGGFIANYHTSGYNERGNQLTPPTKEIIFSGKLRKNDGLLVNYVGEKESVGYLEARKMVAEFVSEIMFKLENGETIELDQIGTLRFDQQENILFEANQLVNLRTDAFGLDSFHFPPLVNKFQQPTKAVFRDKEPEPLKRTYPAVKYILIGLPVLALLYFIPLKNMLNHGESRVHSISNSASLGVSDNPVLPNHSTASEQQSLLPDPNVETAETTTTEANLSVPSPMADKATLAPKVTQPVQPIASNALPLTARGKFHVVGGCFKIKENADKLAEKLLKQGYPAMVSKHGRDFFKVTVESFETRKEAEQGLEKILEVDPDTDYWLMADKR